MVGPLGHRDTDGTSTDFHRAVESLRAARLRPEVVLDEAPAPQRLAPYAVAMTADVLVGDEEIGSGRFVLLHDPAGHETWDGVFRVVTFVRAPLEHDLAADPMLPGVGWAWLSEALDARGAAYTAASGTRHPGLVGELRRDGRPAAHRRDRDPGVLDRARPRPRPASAGLG